MKVTPGELQTDEAGNEFVVDRADESARRVHRDQQGRRFVKRDWVSRILAGVVGVVMLGYAVVTVVTTTVSAPYLRYVGAAAWGRAVPGASLVLAGLAAAIGFGVLRASLSGREPVIVSRSGAIIDDVPEEGDRRRGWEFGNQ
ncbi:MAG: hypothetical protein ABEI31_09885 [Halodesulfurarchaeum sp.]